MSTSGEPVSHDGLPSPGHVLAGKYHVEREIGRGGMGVVYAARHQLLSQTVALKMMLPEVAKNAEAVARFLNEGRAAAKLENPHVARVMDVGTLDSGAPFLVLEMLEGADLAEVARTATSLPVTSVVDWLMEAMEAVAEAHSVGIIHRDLKPSNLFLAQRKGGTIVKVLDFGISKAIADDGTTDNKVSTATNTVLGSPVYMSPEQLRAAKTIDGRADIWSLGVIAYELLTGALPYDAPNVVELFAVIQEREPRPVRELRLAVPQPLEAAILACLKRAPADRWSSVVDFAAAIAPFGSAAAQTSLANILRVDSAKVARPTVRSGVDFSPLARISVPDTDPDDLPSKTMPAMAPVYPTSDVVLRDTKPAISSMTRTTGAVVSSRPARPTSSARRLAAGAMVLLAGGAVVAALLLRPAPPPAGVAAAPPSMPATPVAPAPAAPPPFPPSAVSLASAAPEVIAPPTARPAVSSSRPARSAAPAAASAPRPTKSGVPSDWN